MLKNAYLYEMDIRHKLCETWYDEKYKYFNFGSYDELFMLPDSNIDAHNFASVDSLGSVIGYIGYTINRQSYTVECLMAINFRDCCALTFACDLKRAMQDIFIKYRFNKITFDVIIGNPIEKHYDSIVKKCGGRIVGMYKEHVQLIDGLRHDVKLYEVLRCDYLNSRERKENGGEKCKAD